MLRRWIRRSIPARIFTHIPAVDGKEESHSAGQTSWGVYAKLYQDNLQFLRGILEEAAAAKTAPNKVTQEVAISTALVWMWLLVTGVALARFSRRWT